MSKAEEERAQKENKVMKLIDKDALVAEIEKRRSKNARNKLNLAAAFEDNYLLSFIDTLEMKEVNLDKEIKDYFDNQPIITRSKGVDYQLIPSGENIAKHFFALGMAVSNKAQKGEEV